MGQQLDCLDCLGLISFRIELERRSTNISEWVTPTMQGEIMLSWDTLKELGINMKTEKTKGENAYKVQRLEK